MLLTRIPALTCGSAVSLSSSGGEGQGEEAVYASDTAVHGRSPYSNPQVAGRLPCRFWSQLLHWWRHETIVLHLSHHLHAARAPLQGVPDLPQNTVPIGAPLMIPKAQLLNVFGGQQLISRRVMFLLPRQPVFKAVQFNGQSSRGTIEVKEVSAERMLASEFEPCKAACSQRLPKLRLFACLFASQPPGVTGRIHGVERRCPSRKDKHASSCAAAPFPPPPLEERENHSPAALVRRVRARCRTQRRTPKPEIPAV